MAKKLTANKKALAQDWDEFLRTIRSNTAVDFEMDEHEKARKRAHLEAHPLEWMKFFFYKYAKYEFAGFQKQAIKRLLSHADGNWYEVLSWARELAKSTIVMFIIIYLVMTGRKRNILLVSATQDGAIKLLNQYRGQFEANERLRYFYGELVGLKWTEDHFITSNKASFIALGARQSPRGIKLDELRPDTLLMDDYDTDEECRNPEIVNNKWNWFEQALYFTRSWSESLLTIWTGNIIAKDCCVARAGKKARELADRERPIGHWDIINIRMVDINHPDPKADFEFGTSVWPEKNSEETIDDVQAQVSIASVQKECYNNPVVEGKYFMEIKWGETPPISKFPFLISYGDPAPSNKLGKKSAKNSLKANFIVGVLDGVLYVFTGYLEHVINDEFVNWYYYQNDYVHGRTQLHNYIENNKLQDPFYEQVFVPLFLVKGKERGYYIPISPDTRVKPDKFQRIEGNLEPVNRAGRMVFNIKEKDNPHMKRLEEQFLLFDDGLPAPADGPDAIEGAYFKAQEKMMTLTAGGYWVGHKAPNKKRI